MAALNDYGPSPSAWIGRRLGPVGWVESRLVPAGSAQDQSKVERILRFWHGEHGCQGGLEDEQADVPYKVAA